MDFRGDVELKNKDTKLEVGEKVILGKNIVFGPRCKNIKIGYGSFLGNNIYIDVDYLSIGEYTTIHQGSIIHGVKTIIGHNCWFGQYTIIDSLGGDTRIGNNVGVGAHSQLWSHMKFGDMLNGCRWNSSDRLYIDDDVWLVGHSIVGPIHARQKSMLMTGSVAVKNMEINEIYSGTPAVSISSKMGGQFQEVPYEVKLKNFKSLITDFCNTHNLDSNQFEIVDRFDRASANTQFNVKLRQYRPQRTEAEYRFIKFMLYEKAKWVPVLD